MRSIATPFVAGALMGPMMLSMLHKTLSGGTSPVSAITTFVVGHFAVLLALLASFAVARRFIPQLRNRLGRMHTPRARHVGVMVMSAGATASVVHLAIHGGF
ncbi:hypothetical protein SAMN05444714_2914 [Yoonia litorea]|uniref:Uncharacterized protein n=1 Tax=Yoonia litorea TaxID=1123755 RepID=A0A1I6N184_9RHOB|nr:hypothetical protein SAMN05444714_2914 [Yoonia litorea]